MAESTGWLLRLVAAAVVVMGLAVGTAGARPAWAAPGAVPDAFAQADEDEADEDETDEDDADQDDADTDEDADDADDAASGVDGNTYVSPTFGYELEWDEDDWEVDDEDVGERDFLRLIETDQTSLVYVEGYEGYDGDPDDCLEGSAAEILDQDGIEDVEPLEDEDGDEIAGEDDGVVFAAFAHTAELDDGDSQDRVGYFTCQTLVEDEAVLAFSFVGVADEFEDDLPVWEDLLAAVTLPDAGDDDDDDDLLADVETYEVDDISHTDDPVDYEQTPPVGGAHSSVWQDCGFYDEEIVSESAVHSMEHGAVWITYDPDLDEDEVEILEELADSEAYVLVSPFADLPSPVVASAWGVQLELDGADDPRLEAFVAFYAEGPQTPEPGAPCFGGTDETA